MGFMSRLSLRATGALTILVMLSLALMLSMWGFFKVEAQEDGLDQVRQKVNQINQMINEFVSSPFYMTPRAFDPCNPESLKLIDRPENWDIEYRYSGGEVTCEWIYYKDNEMIAVDGWSYYDRKLVSRVYFQGSGYILATDIFFVLDDSGQVECVKKREYESFNVVECYSEAGSLISIDPMDNLFSPLPPMLYWFSYR